MLTGRRASSMILAAMVGIVGASSAPIVLAHSRAASYACAVGDVSGMELMREVLCGLVQGAGDPADLAQSTLDRLPRGTAAYAPLSSSGTERSVGVRAAEAATATDIPASVLDKIPRGKVGYAPAMASAPPGTNSQRAVPPGFACELVAYNPYVFKQPRLPFSVYGGGFNSCTTGLNMRSQACVFKQHHVLLIPYYKVARCSVVRSDRRATFRPVSVRYPCAAGVGKWRTLIFGSIFANGRRQSGAVQSVKDMRLPCN